ncbi:MAG: glycine dehydrogenase, partial [Patiriisocius sp.]
MNIAAKVIAPATLSELENQNEFVRRHIGPGQQEIADMLDVVGADSLDDLMQQTVPAGIRSAGLNVGEAQREDVALAELKAISKE